MKSNIKLDAGLPDLGFISLPAEIRLQIYGYILEPQLSPVLHLQEHNPAIVKRADRRLTTRRHKRQDERRIKRGAIAPPTSETFREYWGLILSCRQVYDEFEVEYLKIFTHFLEVIHQNWPHAAYPLKVSTPTCLSDPIDLRIGIPIESVTPYSAAFHGRPRTTTLKYPIRPFLLFLIDRLPSFTLYLHVEGEASLLTFWRDLHHLRQDVEGFLQGGGCEMVLNSDKNWKKGVLLDLDENRSVIDYKAQYNPKTPKTGKPLFHWAPQCGAPEASSLLH